MANTLLHVFLYLCYVLSTYTAGTLVKTAKVSQTPLTLEEYLSNKYVADYFNGTWVTDTAFVFRDDQRNIRRFDVTTGTSSVIVSITDLVSIPTLSMHDFQLAIILLARKYLMYAPPSVTINLAIK